MSQQKVVILGPAFPFRGGIAHFNNALADSFVKNGFEVNVFSFSLQYPSILFPGKSQYEEGIAPEAFKIHETINSINPLSWFSTSRKIIALKPKFIVVRYWLPFMAPALGTISRFLRKKGIKVIAITDNIIPHEKRIGDITLTKFFVKSCDGFVTLSQSVLDDISKFTNNTNKKFVPHPIYDIFGTIKSKDEALHSLKLDHNDKHLLFFGFIRHYKGLDILLEALSDDRLKDVKLIIAGEFYERKEEYLRLINSLKIESQIIFKSSFIPNDEVKDYFCAADLITQTYRTATQSGVTQIAYHFERPMLVTDVGGLAEIVPNNKVGYVTDVSALKVADAIVDFYQNDRESFFIENIKLEKKRFDWNYLVQAILELV